VKIGWTGHDDLLILEGEGLSPSPSRLNKSGGEGPSPSGLLRFPSGLQ
jgi:hypothetical protein